MQESHRNGQDDSDIVKVNEPFTVTRVALNRHSSSAQGRNEHWRTQKIFMEGSFICIWCALLMTSQFDVTFMFPNQRFGEVC